MAYERNGNGAEDGHQYIMDTLSDKFFYSTITVYHLA